MPYVAGIGKVPEKYCFSITDFHDFDFCQFRFYVNHHLRKKYEIAEGSLNMTLGSLLDQAIKNYHLISGKVEKLDELTYLVKAAYKSFVEDLSKKGDKPSFYSSMKPFLTEETLKQAEQIFMDYYKGLEGKVNKSLGQVEFCKSPIKSEDGSCYLLWGWPDAYELAPDGMPEVVDYKFRENIERGKDEMDMDLMPKLYILLASDFLRTRGYKKARFRVRFWQVPKEEGFYEEFDLGVMDGATFLFKQKIDRILNNKEIRFCEKPFCKACKSDKRSDFLKQLQELGLNAI